MPNRKKNLVSNGFGPHHAAAYIHDVKNVLSVLMSKAEASHDSESMHLLMDADYKLNHLLVLYKSEADMMTVNIEPVDANSFLEIIAANYQPLTEKSIVVETSDEAPIAYIDKSLVELCIGNALHNAERFAKQAVHLSVREEAGMTVFRVRDDGEGYPEAVLHHSGKHVLNSSDSSGLGFYLASKIVEHHINKSVHGYLKVFNDQGAVLDLYFP